MDAPLAGLSQDSPQQYGAIINETPINETRSDVAVVDEELYELIE